MAGEPTTPDWRTPAKLSAVALAAFAILLLDTAWRGPISALAQPTSNAIAQWSARGPVEPVGRAVSLLGDFAVRLVVLAAALAVCLWAKAWRHAATVAGFGLGVMVLMRSLQPALSKLNRPLEGLSTYVVPESPTQLREGGYHLFPSGHTLEGSLAWGLLLLVALETWHLGARHRRDADQPRPLHPGDDKLTTTLPRAEFRAGAAARQAAHRRWRIAAQAAWACLAVAIGIGRLMAKAHGLNDVMAGWALGLAFTAAALACARAWASHAARRHALRRSVGTPQPPGL